MAHQIQEAMHDNNEDGPDTRFKVTGSFALHGVDYVTWLENARVEAVDHERRLVVRLLRDYRHHVRDTLGADAPLITSAGRYTVDGYSENAVANPDATLDGDGTFAPFFVFDADGQEHLKEAYGTRAEAEAVAAFLNEEAPTAVAPPPSPRYTLDGTGSDEDPGQGTEAPFYAYDALIADRVAGPFQTEAEANAVVAFLTKHRP